MSSYCSNTQELLTRQRSILVFDCIIPKRHSLMMAFMILRRVNYCGSFPRYSNAALYSDGYRGSLTRQLWRQLSWYSNVSMYVVEFHDHNETHQRKAVVLYIIISQRQQWMFLCYGFVAIRWCFSWYFNVSIHRVAFTMRQHMAQIFQLFRFEIITIQYGVHGWRDFLLITMPHHIMLPHVPVLISCSNTILI